MLFLFLPFFLGLLCTTVCGWMLVFSSSSRSCVPCVASAKVRFFFFYAFQTWSLLQFFRTLADWLMSWIITRAGMFDYFYPPEPPGASRSNHSARIGIRISPDHAASDYSVYPGGHPDGFLSVSTAAVHGSAAGPRVDKGSTKEAPAAGPVCMNTLLLAGLLYAGVSGIMSYRVLFGGLNTMDEDYERKMADEQQTAVQEQRTGWKKQRTPKCRRRTKSRHKSSEQRTPPEEQEQREQRRTNSERRRKNRARYRRVYDSESED